MTALFLTHLGCIFLGWLGCWLLWTNLASYYRGHRDGRNEERSRQNARIITAKLEGCKKGREAERGRTYRFDLRATNPQN